MCRNLNRRVNRRIPRHSTRMLGGARRPSPPNYLAIICRALTEVIRIDKRLLPFMAEQREMLNRWLFDQEIQGALNKVYGKAEAGAVPRSPFTFFRPPESDALLRKEELALAKSRQLLAVLRAKLARNR